MAQCIQELGTYEFQVIYCPGKKHGNADGLSRVPCNYCGRVETKGEEESEVIVATILWGQDNWQGPCQRQRLDEHVGGEVFAGVGGGSSIASIASYLLQSPYFSIHFNTSNIPLIKKFTINDNRLY